jgi:oxygen-independent coproporphyrinogen-3 oxidase
MPPLGLYLHVPFCSAICNYCNFNRGLYDGALKARYVGALIEEIRRADCLPADTIYFGGGTPSLLEPHEVASLVDACRDTFAMPREVEVTLEANPETVTTERLTRFRAAGVNRLSLGVQSFRDDELQGLSRVHGAAGARAAYESARRAGFDNVSLDLMMWLPDQTLGRWMESVDALVTLEPDHASLYMLELYPHAPLREEMVRAGRALADDDEAAEMYLAAMARLDRAGFEQYEISNVARAGRRGRHNLKYWTDGEWLGFGCGAHSTSGGVRWKNVSGTDEYVRRVTAGLDLVSERRVLDASGRVEEALFTGLRLNDGIDIDEVGARYGVDVWQRYGEALGPSLDAGLLCRNGARLWLTRQGMLVSHEVMAVFV